MPNGKRKRTIAEDDEELDRTTTRTRGSETKMPEETKKRRLVLVYSGPDDNAAFYESIRAVLSKILDERKYEVKQLKHAELVSTPPTKSSLIGGGGGGEIVDALIVNNDGGSKKFADAAVQKAFLDYFVNSGKLVFCCNPADGRDALWMLKSASSAEGGAPFPDSVGAAYEKFAQNQPVPVNLQSFQLQKSTISNPPSSDANAPPPPIDYAVGLVRGQSDLSYMYFICEDGDTAVFLVSKSPSLSGFGSGEQGKTESFWRDVLRVLRLIGVEVLPISASQAAQTWGTTTTTTPTAGGGGQGLPQPPPAAPAPEPMEITPPPKVLIYGGGGGGNKEAASITELQTVLKGLIIPGEGAGGKPAAYDVELLDHQHFAESGAPWRRNCAVLFVDNRDWATRFDEPTRKSLTDYFSESGKLVFFCDPKEGRKAMWLLKAACGPNEQWPEAVGKAYEHFAQNQPVPTDLQAIQTQKKKSSITSGDQQQQLTDLSLGLIKGGNGAFTYLKCEDGDTAVFVAMTVDEVVTKRGSFIWSELLRVVGLPSAAPASSQMPPSPSVNPVVGELTRVVKFINTGASAASTAASSLLERASRFFTGDDHSPDSATGIIMSSKPPNLLIYSAAAGGGEDAKKLGAFSDALRRFLAPNKYTVYPLKRESIAGDQRAPWAANCRVLFVDNADPEKGLSGSGAAGGEAVKKAFSDYFLHYGGRLVFFCDPQSQQQQKSLWFLDQLAANPIGDAPQKWPDSVAEAFDRFVRTGERSAEIAPIGSTKFSVAGSDEECCIKYLGGFRGTPAILQFSTGGNGSGSGSGSGIVSPRAVFVAATFDQLCAESGGGGEEIWANILDAVGLESAANEKETAAEQVLIKPVTGTGIPLTDAVVFFKNEELASPIKNAYPKGVVELPTIKAAIMEAGETQQQQPGGGFDSKEYFQNLKSKRFGHVVIYAPILPSTMPVSDDWHNAFEKDDYVVVTSQQTRGTGRGGNQWLSPLGSAVFSFSIHVSQKSSLGKHLSFLQHLVTLAAADSIHQLHPTLNVRIKWPNDIYYGTDTKIGGVLVKANFVKEQFLVSIGTGINVSNAIPTACLNDFLPADSKPLTREQVIAITLTRLEQLIELFQAKGADAVFPLYYKYWLHSNQKVTVASSGEEVTIVGLDEFGFLDVKAVGSGKRFTLHPDGNSFDMMQNLIKAKESG